MPRTFSRAAIFLRGPSCRALFLLTVVGLFSACLPAFGLWLPWASEEQKVKKTVDDVWQALTANDQALLKQRLAGSGAKLFIDQERQKIKSFNIKSYECKIKSVKIDPTTKSWAFVEYETVASLGNGKKMAVGALSVLQKIGGEWKFLTGIKAQGIAGQGQKKESPFVLPGKTDAQTAQPSSGVSGPQ
ncbi:MAG: hypothetical protein ACLP5H_03290 [Desulfomonilaceae bacterium]